MFDTHCHLNFAAFKNNLDEVIGDAKKAGVNYFVVPGTDYESSKRAIEIAERYEGVYAAVGIHPHHAAQYVIPSEARDLATRQLAESVNCASLDFSVATLLRNDIKAIEKLLKNPEVVAIGEVGIDRHLYKKTIYQNYQVDEEFIKLQKEIFLEQLKLARRYKKSLIIHNRQAKEDVLAVLTDYRLLITNYRCVFHCCEPDDDLLNFAKKYKIFIGVDGDVTYDSKSFDSAQDKQEFVKKIPLELLVLETDSPFLHPEKGKFPNEPKNLPVIAEFISKLINVSINQLIKTTTENSQRLFQVNFKLKKYQR